MLEIDNRCYISTDTYTIDNKSLQSLSPYLKEWKNRANLIDVYHT